MNKPDFIGVGTERAGTSWVFSMLAHHPDVWVPPLKELHFLDTIDESVPSHNPRYKWHLTSRIKQKLAPLLKWEHRPEFYKNNFWEYLLWDYYYFTKKMDFDWYLRLFSETFTKGRLCGEYTPAYCNINEQYIEQLLRINPNMKFLMIVRNPYDQLRSSIIQHFVMIENRHFHDVKEEEILEWLNSSFAYKKNNLQEILFKWKKLVPEKQLFIEFFDHIKNDPEKIIQNLYKFLNLNTKFMPDQKFYSTKINNITKPDYTLSETVESILIDRTKSETEFFQKIKDNIRT